MRRIALLVLCLVFAGRAFGQSAATPTFSPGAGTYTSAQSVTISTTSSGSTFAGANGPSSGGGSGWSNGNNVTLNDGSYATVSLPNNNSSSPLIVQGFGFSIPSGATINGIALTVVHGDISSIGSLEDVSVFLEKAGTPTGSNLGQIFAIWSGAPETFNYGGTSNLWGTTWTASDINASNFGVAFRVRNNAGGGTGVAGVDFMSITVYYSVSAIICYTTNGVTPVTNGVAGCTTGVLYSGPVTVSVTETILAVAGGAGFTDSTVGNAAYIILLPAATPTCSPGSGTYSTGQSVSCSDTSPSSIMCYTLNGSTPATNGASACSVGTLYSGAISVSVSETLNIIAGGSLYTDGPVATYTYVILLASGTPTFSPVAGTYPSGQSVTISSSAFTVICYTSNGTTPATNGAAGCSVGTLYSGPVNVPSTRTLKAIAGGTGFNDSSVASALYTIQVFAIVPTCLPGTSSFTGSVLVACTEASGGAVICYTTNGTTPATNGTTGCTTGTLYSSSLTFVATTTLKVIGGGTGYTDSSVNTYTYTLTVAPISPVPCKGCVIGQIQSKNMAAHS